MADEVDANTTRVEFDQASSLFGQFKDPAIDQVGLVLDNKLHNLMLRPAGLAVEE